LREPRIVIVAEPRVPAEAAPARAPDAALEESALLANKQDWPGLSRQLDAVQQLKLPPDVEPSISSLRDSSRQLEKLTALEGALTGARPGGVSKAAQLAEASPALRQPVRDLKSLEGLQASLKTDWNQAPKLAELENGVAAYGRVAGKEKALELRWQLARAAALRGHRELAQRLLPPGRNAAELPPTRDLRPGGAGGDEFVGPLRPGERPPNLVPEAPPGARPGVRESVLDGLGETGNGVKAAVNTGRQRAAEAVRGEKARHTQQVGHHLAHLTHHLRDKDRDRREDSASGAGSPVKSVASALGRPLTASERVLAEVMARRGQAPAQIAARLRELQEAK
jgi:hypothetical protein